MGAKCNMEFGRMTKIYPGLRRSFATMAKLAHRDAGHRRCESGVAKVVSVGRGNIIVDSGAAESVMPKDMLPCQVAVEGVAKLMDNYGEKKVRFHGGGIKSTNSITFQVTDVGNPLAAVSNLPLPMDGKLDVHCLQQCLRKLG